MGFTMGSYEVTKPRRCHDLFADSTGTSYNEGDEKAASQDLFLFSLL